MHVNLKRGVVAAAVVLLASCGGGGSGGDPLFGGGGGGGGGISDVSNGVPSQRSMSMAVETYNLEWGIDGDETEVSVRVTDTAGNPVPDGTLVQFSTEGGQVITSCALQGVPNDDGDIVISACSATFATQNPRPGDGLISIVAWLVGQEAFIDSNGNGRYDSGEPFYDTGRVFRDDDQDSAYTDGVDELIVGSAPGLGSAACGPKLATAEAFDFGVLDDNEPASVPNTCDNAWGRTLVRAQRILPVSDSRYLSASFAGGTLTVFTELPSGVQVAAPAGTAIGVVSAPDGCDVTVTPSTVPNNVVFPTAHVVNATGTCGGSIVFDIGGRTTVTVN